MCGFAGIHDAHRGTVDAAVIDRMAAMIAHRGPDDHGIYVEPGVGLAARRLAIIDRSPAGHQPMKNEDGSVILVYNGELYNFRELRRELEAKRHVFRSRTDTEVVVHAYEEWGDDAIERFNGMFAFALWDRGRRRLLLARDRLGVKPLYYGSHGGRLVFGSEVKALLEAGLPARVCPEALVEYFTFQNVLTDLTLFEGVRILPAGHVLVADEHGSRLRQYWDALDEPAETGSLDECSERVREIFERAVQRQLVSDAPLGSFLSGGMDSGSIVAMASRDIPHLRTFTGGFDLSSATGFELVFDERDDAELMASAVKSEHYEVVMHSGDMPRVLPELVWHLEDLRMGMSYQNYYICRLAGHFVRVSLAGTGGDELFAGYPWRYAPFIGPGAVDFDRQHFSYWNRLVPEEEHGRFFTGDVLEAAGGHSPRDVYREVMRPVDTLDPLTRALYFELKTFLHGLLVVDDKLSMAHSLEVRVPFLDSDLVDIALRIPSGLKHRGEDGKPVLRRAMRGILPERILQRPKQGFSPPDGSWYRGETTPYIKEILLDERTRSRGYFDQRYVSRILDEHVDGRVNHRLLIWSLLCFEWWNRLFVDGAVAPSDASKAAQASLSTRNGPIASESMPVE